MASGAAEPSPPSSSDSSEATPSPFQSRVDQANAIIRRNVMLSLAVGLVPIPIIDFVGMEVIHVRMLNELGKLYGLDFMDDDAGKKIAGSLLSAVWGVSAGAALGYSLSRFVPVIGTTVGMMAMPLLGASSTRALGKTFVMHFESGGTLLDFDPQKMRSHFITELGRSREAVAAMRDEIKKPS